MTASDVSGKILVMGLPGSGKTTLSKVLARRLHAVHFNADEIRHNINKDLGFSVEDRIEQARRMGWLCDRVVEAGNLVIADFICPTPETRSVFGEAFVVWVDRIKESRFDDTDRLFVPPDRFDVRVTASGTPEYWAEQIALRLRATDIRRRISLGDRWEIRAAVKTRSSTRPRQQAVGASRAARQ